MDLNIGRELTWARGLTRGKRKLSVTPLRCRDRRLVHRPVGADSLEGWNRRNRRIMNRRIKFIAVITLVPGFVWFAFRSPQNVGADARKPRAALTTQEFLE